MATPNEKLADSLKVLKEQQYLGKKIFQSEDFSRIHRERLVAAGFLMEIIKGWYLLSNPQAIDGDSTSWLASFWEFVSVYCNTRFGNDWNLAPNDSLLRHVEHTVTPRQVIVNAQAANDNILNLKFNTSIFDRRTKDIVNPENIVVKDGIRLLSLPVALIQSSPNFFKSYAGEATIALSQISDPSEILAKLLEGGNSVVAGRIAGALRATKRPDDADNIVQTMRRAGYAVTETNPFEAPPPNIEYSKQESPCAMRIRLMWESMRDDVINAFPESPGIPEDIDQYMADVDDRHIEDAYHSLSIEGYKVTEELIEKIASGTWDPEINESDKRDKDAMAAKGYYQAFITVRDSVKNIIMQDSLNPGEIIRKDHRNWYQELFGPSVSSGILKPYHLAGYRSSAVIITNSRHAPPSHESIRNTMPVFFDLLAQEDEPSVRAVLGHFIFVYLHPYMDGNGRMARFLMNSMLASGGYPWTVVRVEDRDGYMQALDSASTLGDIKPFANFIGDAVERQILINSEKNKIKLPTN